MVFMGHLWCSDYLFCESYHASLTVECSPKNDLKESLKCCNCVSKMIQLCIKNNSSYDQGGESLDVLQFFFSNLSLKVHHWLRKHFTLTSWMTRTWTFLFFSFGLKSKSNYSFRLWVMTTIFTPFASFKYVFRRSVA